MLTSRTKFKWFFCYSFEKIKFSSQRKIQSLEALKLITLGPERLLDCFLLLLFNILVLFLLAFMLYTLNVAMAFAFLSSLYGDFMQVCSHFISTYGKLKFLSYTIISLTNKIPVVSFLASSSTLSFMVLLPVLVVSLSVCCCCP